MLYNLIGTGTGKEFFIISDDSFYTTLQRVQSTTTTTIGVIWTRTIKLIAISMAMSIIFKIHFKRLWTFFEPINTLALKTIQPQ